MAKTQLPDESAFQTGVPLAEEFGSFRNRVTRMMIHYTLVESLENFRLADMPYPFVSPALMKPGSVVPSYEHLLHNNALLLLLDGHFPKKLRKHFRCREVNRVRKKNISDVAPDLDTLHGIVQLQRFSSQVGFEDLLRTLLPLDYSLLIQKSLEGSDEKGQYELTHFHVKIERLMDNALRNLGVSLHYLSQNLYERGDAFVEALEKKYFEYFNFYHNAAGRRSAAALAAQLLAQEKMTATTYIASQQDRRLTLFSSEPETTEIRVEQYILLELNSMDTTRLIGWGDKVGLDIIGDFLIDTMDGKGVFLFRADYEHTDAGRPSSDGELKSGINPREKWIRLKGEEILSWNPEVMDVIAFPIVYRNILPWKELRVGRLE